MTDTPLSSLGNTLRPSSSTSPSFSSYPLYTPLPIGLSSSILTLIQPNPRSKWLLGSLPFQQWMHWMYVRHLSLLSSSPLPLPLFPPLMPSFLSPSLPISPHLPISLAHCFHPACYGAPYKIGGWNHNQNFGYGSFDFTAQGPSTSG